MFVYQKSKIPDEAWDFRFTPKNQFMACYFYEIGMESEKIKSEIKNDRRRIATRKKRKSDFLAWCESNPQPHLDDEDDPLWDEYLNRMNEASPIITANSRLPCYLQFLITCQHFPQKHWLQIPLEERVQIAARLNRLRMNMAKPAIQAKKPMLIQPLANVLLSPDQYAKYRKGSIQLEHYVISFFRDRHPTMLIKDFRNWLRNNPSEKLPFYKSNRSSNKTTHSDLLNHIGAFRLMRVYKNNHAAVQRHSGLSYGKDHKKPLYQNAQTWRKNRDLIQKLLDAI